MGSKQAISNGKKVCSSCGENLNISSYGRRPERPQGIRSRCKECSRAYRMADMKAYKFTMYKSGAKRRNFYWELTNKEFNSFWKLPCSYCGEAIETIGLDRMDNCKGYTVDNIVPCCEICNRMKRDQSFDEFISRCKTIVEKFG